MSLEEVIDWMDARKDKYYRIGWVYLKSTQDIEDAFHNTILKAYENIKNLRRLESLEAWITKIFINECRAIIKKRGKLELLESVDVGISFTDTDHLELSELLNSLDLAHREVVMLKYLAGYPLNEIAQLLDIPVGTVKSRIHRGLRLLRVSMEKEVQYEL